MNRRELITGLISLVAAPAIVRAGSLMPVKTMIEMWPDHLLIQPENVAFAVYYDGSKIPVTMEWSNQTWNGYLFDHPPFPLTPCG